MVIIIIICLIISISVLLITEILYLITIKSDIKEKKINILDRRKINYNNNDEIKSNTFTKITYRFLTKKNN